MLVTAKHIVGVGLSAAAGGAASSNMQTAEPSMHEASVSAYAEAGQAEDSGSSSGWYRQDSSVVATAEPSSADATAADTADVIVNSSNGACIGSSGSASPEGSQNGSNNDRTAGGAVDSNGSSGSTGSKQLDGHSSSHGSGASGDIVSMAELEALVDEAGAAAWGKWASLPAGVQTATGLNFALGWKQT
jgi:hypothetical protein